MNDEIENDVDENDEDDNDVDKATTKNSLLPPPASTSPFSHSTSFSILTTIAKTWSVNSTKTDRKKEKVCMCVCLIVYAHIKLSFPNC